MSTQLADDDDVDFMSDEFLKECTKTDVRPGLLYKSSDKRKHEQLKRKKDKPLSRSQLEEVHRTVGLGQAIGADNKGFKMLEKMGFKSGESLGKRSGVELKEPIPIEIKRGRGCLGQKTILAEKQKKIEALGDVSSFRERLHMNSIATQTKLDLDRAKRICQSLDQDSGREQPIDPWYWPIKIQEKSTDPESQIADDAEEDPDNDIDVPDVKEQLQLIVNHLRTAHFYCIWCGATFGDSEDMGKCCPGVTREDH